MKNYFYSPLSYCTQYFSSFVSFSYRFAFFYKNNLDAYYFTCEQTDFTQEEDGDICIVKLIINGQNNTKDNDSGALFWTGYYLIHRGWMQSEIDKYLSVVPMIKNDQDMENALSKFKIQVTFFPYKNIFCAVPNFSGNHYKSESLNILYNNNGLYGPDSIKTIEMIEEKHILNKTNLGIRLIMGKLCK